LQKSLFTVQMTKTSNMSTIFGALRTARPSEKDPDMRTNSSPASNIGVPWDNSKVANRLWIWRSRKRLTSVAREQMLLCLP